MKCNICGAPLGTSGGWTDPTTGKQICKDCYYKKFGEYPKE